MAQWLSVVVMHPKPQHSLLERPHKAALSPVAALLKTLKPPGCLHLASDSMALPASQRPRVSQLVLRLPYSS